MGFTDACSLMRKNPQNPPNAKGWPVTLLRFGAPLCAIKQSIQKTASKQRKHSTRLHCLKCLQNPLFRT
ncbi:hypothetical protein [Azospirillum brasilense]|uniref:hypothetical protein n=1 Tax=Azospirillum brasilense TaxID=192 RepID=UPI00119EE42A|nr:hypothetical protein [Azospirillum brasilense]